MSDVTGPEPSPEHEPHDPEHEHILRAIEHVFARSGRALSDLEHRAVPAWQTHTQGEQRWIVSATVAVAIALQLTLPRKLGLPPQWLLPILGAALLVGLLIANPTRIDRRSMRLRATSISLVVVLSLSNAASAVRLIAGVLDGKLGSKAGALLVSGGAIWATNVIVFGLWYWELDRGGPAARAHGVKKFPDFAFTQMMSPDLAPPDWEPAFLDYLYLSFTNATAFSPTDVLPMNPWAKMTMMFQSAISLSTVALVIARAVNILQ
ncbi:MAG TPA: hypothetical protein VGM78_15665 [Ilumatobacteraceae bacterium]|jgi:hypothetical protein